MRAADGRWRTITRLKMTAMKLAALIRYAVAIPNAAMMPPASAGPIMRVPWNVAEFSATTWLMRRAGTSSGRNAWYAGMS